MRASVLVSILQEIIREYGDLPISSDGHLNETRSVSVNENVDGWTIALEDVKFDPVITDETTKYVHLGN